jgi:hypothetical protein
LKSLTSALLPILVTAAAAAVATASCSAGNNGSSFTTGNGASGAGASGHGGAQSSSSGDIGFGANGPGSTGSGTGNAGGSSACAAEPHQAMQLPLDMFIMLDQSGSMSDTVSGGATKWEAVTGALQTFLTQPGLGGISVGIQYFGLPPGGGQQCNPAATCATDADCGAPACGPCMIIIPGFGVCLGASGGDSCTAADYAKAEVEIAPLPGVASAIITSMGQHGPTTSTPTAPALQGAIQHAQTWASSHPGHVVIAVMATDGLPTECTPEDAAGISAIAAQGNQAGIKTFTIGVFAPADQPAGPNLLNQVSAAGGTGMSFTISTNGNVGQQFLDALNVIRGAALGCQYNIPVPEAGMADYGKVNVQYTPGGGGSPVIFTHYQDKSQCPASGDGWYYDNNASPTQIILCDPTCNKVGADATGKIDILLGCKTKEPA